MRRSAGRVVVGGTDEEEEEEEEDGDDEGTRCRPHRSRGSCRAPEQTGESAALASWAMRVRILVAFFTV